MIAAVLPTDSDLEAFCGDCFPDVAARFANGMDRLAKVNLLLAVEAAALPAALLKYHPQRAASYAHLLIAPAEAQGNPYRGLSAFQVEDAHLFFGREALTEKLWQRFKALHDTPQAARLLAILGPSGSGKSSVARAGLLAALERRPIPGPQPARMLSLKPGEHPLRALALALRPPLAGQDPDLAAQRKLVADLGQPNQGGQYDGLTLWAANLPEIAASPLVLLVDQFEEVYTLGADRTERDAFVGLLLDAAQDSARHVAVILTLRSDFLGETHRQHPVLNRLIAEQSAIVPAMDPAELRRAIVQPAAQAGRPIDAATVDLLLAETRGSEGALPLLEFALASIWTGMQAGKEPGATLREIGGVGGALAGQAQKLYGALSAEEQQIARRALVRLVQLGEGTRDTRRRAPIPELCGRGQTEAAVLAVLRKFATESARLVTLSEAGAEVTHEALFDHWTELRRWIDESRADRRLHDRAAEAARLWEADSRPTGRLWRRPDLDLLCDYQKRKPEELNPLQAAFLRSSEQQQQRDRLLRWGSAVAVFVALVMAAGIYITKERQLAREERQRIRDAEEANKKISQQNKQMSEQLALMVTEQAWQLLKDMPLEAIPSHIDLDSRCTSMIESLKRARYREEAKRSGDGRRAGANSSMYSPSGKHTATVNEDQTARVSDISPAAPTADEIAKLIRDQRGARF